MPVMAMTGPGPSARIRNVVLVAVWLAGAQLVQGRGRKCGQQLQAAHVSAVVEVIADVERVEAAVVRIERILVAEVVIADEELVLGVDVVIEAQIEELHVLDGGPWSEGSDEGSPMAAALAGVMVTATGVPRSRCSYAPKTKSLFFLMGPPAFIE